MPRFFFHARDGDQRLDDPEGVDLPDLDAARAEAAVGAREIAAGRIRQGQMLDGQSLEICDEAGRTLATIPLADAARLP
jgi:hypothetical protein